MEVAEARRAKITRGMYASNGAQHGGRGPTRGRDVNLRGRKIIRWIKFSLRGPNVIQMNQSENN